MTTRANSREPAGRSHDMSRCRAARGLALLSCGLWLLAGAVLPLPGGAAELLEASTYHADEVMARTGQVWLGLFPSGRPEAYVLRKTRIVVAVVDDPVTGTGKAVRATGPVAPLFLVRGEPTLRGGDVEGCTIRVRDEGGRWRVAPGPGLTFDTAGEAAFTPTQTQATLSLRRATLQLAVRVTFSEPAAGGGHRDRSCHIDVSSGALRQRIYALSRYGEGGGGLPSLLWAGDLDGDGKVDLLLDTTWHYNLRRPTLFLSGKARQGQLVAPVGAIESVGC